LRDRRVDLAIADDLPPISLDYLMIDQVVTNLLENAVKYTPAGQPVEVHVLHAADALRVAIADHGPGIPADRRAAVFDKFYRLDRGASTKGSGLGLAVTKGLVDGHGGRVWIEETPGGGATFLFELPLTTGTAPAPPPGPEPLQTATVGRLS
jgi:two-component system sensor histidine kinase KdpD